MAPVVWVCPLMVAMTGLTFPTSSCQVILPLRRGLKLTPGINAVDALFGQEGTGPDINFFGGKARLYSATAPFDVVVANTTVQANTWTHVAISRSGTSLSLYLNGSLDATGTWSGSLPVQALGRRNQSASGYLEGELDEVRVWSIARSGSEINANYNQSVSSGSAGLAAYWTFNGSGQAVADESESGNDGLLGVGAGTGSDDPSRIVSTAPITENCSGVDGNLSPIAINDSVMVKFSWKDFKPLFSFLWFFDEGFYNQ